MDGKKGRVALCTPIANGPWDREPAPEFLASYYSDAALIEEAGWTSLSTFEIGNPYISAARATMLRRALDAKADVIVFLDYDVSWVVGDLLRLIETPGDVVAGTYRFKDPDKDEYMGRFFPADDSLVPIYRDDGCIKARVVPAGFLKVTRAAVGKIIKAYPELVYGDPCSPSVDLFQHGAHEGVWWGEDYAFCRRWRGCGGDVWLIPDLRIDHHARDEVYPGNFQKWMERQAAGDKTPQPPISKRPAEMPELVSAADMVA